MSIRRLATLAALALVPAAPGPAVAAAMDMGAPAPGQRSLHVTMPGQYFTPARLSAVTGDTVSWEALSGPHTVTGDTWGSGRLGYGDTYRHAFTAPGTYLYVCQIHHFMRGVITVSDVLLDAPATPSGPGRPYPVTGRTMAAPGGDVTIEGDSGSGYAPLATTTVNADGTFSATVRPVSSVTLRAVSGTDASPPVRLTVVDRTVTLRDVRRGRTDRLTAAVRPAAPGATVTLQLRLRERFGWWRVAVGRLDARSRATFVLHGAVGAPARANLTLADGWTVLATSPSVGVGRP